MISFLVFLFMGYGNMLYSIVSDLCGNLYLTTARNSEINTLSKHR